MSSHSCYTYTQAQGRIQKSVWGGGKSGILGGGQIRPGGGAKKFSAREARRKFFAPPQNNFAPPPGYKNAQNFDKY